ncbi:alkylated DNA repair protein [Corynebacterium variabile]|uniref:Alkylated DNA repair protein n=2 Tax=Corynebacterium variabile TaxID=1727 RepID=A0A4Y4C4I6_9CORY|nr:alkylated DNA repair protein [Corynebacterium variabile]
MAAVPSEPDQHGLFDMPEPPREPVDLPSGARFLPDWLTMDQQQWIVRQYRQWRNGPVPPRRPRYGSGQMSVEMLSLGWHWAGNGFSRNAVDVNNARILPMPDWAVKVGRMVTGDPTYTPDSLLANHYGPGATMGMHRDADESSPAPVVSLSIGDTCRFRFGNAETRTKPYTDVELRSGDTFVFGGPARWNFHGVPRVLDGTAPDECGITGRLNITMRVTGMDS